MNEKVRISISGMLAGIAIGIGGYGFLYAKTMFEYGQFIGALIFPIGLFLVCAFGLHLYTGRIGNVVLCETKEDKLSYLYDLAIMLLGNLIGAMLVGICVNLVGGQLVGVSVNVMSAKKVFCTNDVRVYFTSIKSKWNA